MKTDPVSRSSQPLIFFEDNLSVSDNGFPNREYAQGIFIFQVREVDVLCSSSFGETLLLSSSVFFYIEGMDAKGTTL